MLQAYMKRDVKAERALKVGRGSLIVSNGDEEVKRRKKTDQKLKVSEETKEKEVEMTRKKCFDPKRTRKSKGACVLFRILRRPR